MVSRSRERFVSSVGDYDTLCLGGGGMKCFSYIGGFHILQATYCEKGETIADLFDNFCGASGGAMVATLTAARCTINELELQAHDVKLRERIFKKNALNLISPKSGVAGMNDGSAIKEFMKGVLLEKKVLKPGESDLTFVQFKERTGKAIAFSVAYIYVDDILMSTVKPHVEIVGNRPEDAEALVVETCVDSMRITPYIQPRFDEKQRRFAFDGGFYMNVPACAFDVKKTFIMRTKVDPEVERRELLESIHSTGERSVFIKDLNNGKINVLDSFKTLLLSYMSMMDDVYDKEIPHEIHEWGTVYMGVPVSYVDDFYMSSQKISKIIEMGRNGVRQLLGKLAARALIRDRISDEKGKSKEIPITSRNLFKTKTA